MMLTLQDLRKVTTVNVDGKSTKNRTPILYFNNGPNKVLIGLINGNKIGLTLADLLRPNELYCVEKMLNLNTDPTLEYKQSYELVLNEAVDNCKYYYELVITDINDNVIHSCNTQLESITEEYSRYIANDNKNIKAAYILKHTPVLKTKYIPLKM